ncbi:probable inactive peptidyl-prolyl cis-trans isomerase-like 6 [Microplitis mediator]|uniref:probable inactive peptidyl-prolyl cis-trans isomerase-like 6 n=1 Tax=Microplitis mediator TaxID=375433 RepID=UPI0025554A42|nr:probable inactive peptidyl-prolyl cis-trans isomerase-like 6 [Microplitis mediator]
METEEISLRIQSNNSIEQLKIKIYGLMSAVVFQKSKYCVLKLYKHLPHKFLIPEIREMYQIEWYDYLEKIRRTIGGKTWLPDTQVIIYINNKFIGNHSDFSEFINENFTINLPIDTEFYENLITESFKKFISNPDRKFVYLNLTIDGTSLGTFIFMLYYDELPRTCEYFINLCNGDKIKKNEEYLCYKNSTLHRIVKDRWLQFGDLGYENNFTNETTIDAENFIIFHDRRGVLSLANDGKNHNGPQFVVSLNPNPWMDKCYVAFG